MAEGGIYIYVSQNIAKQVSVLSMAPETGKLTPVQDIKVDGKAEPMCISPDRRFLYLALRSKPFKVASFAIDGQTGKLTLLGYTPVVESVVNISTDRTGRWLLCAINPNENHETLDRYAGGRRTGMVCVMPIGERGVVQGPWEAFRTPPKLHSLLPDPTNRFLFGMCCDADVVWRHEFDAVTGIVNPDALPPIGVLRKAGPRHFKFHPNNRFMYLVNEYDGAVYTFRYDPRNASLQELQILPSAPPDFDMSKHTRTSDVHFTPDGKWLYVAVRNSATIAAYSCDPTTGLLTQAGHFPTSTGPRSFTIDPLGRYLFVSGMLTKDLWSYKINQETGALIRQENYAVGEGPNWTESARL